MNERRPWSVRNIQLRNNDNIAKSVLDAMTQAGVWVDDKQVTTLSVRKRYAANEGVTVKVHSLLSNEVRQEYWGAGA